ncbi:helix-turn-helix domain-containing protein [Streptomyces sp. OF3]|uniref:Helix-turn-helix domain-containing protein n=1 Tax=Streptomyces alkaliterrae TaxID=2213162 RepID=A0A7W3WLM9_9ACTN|nr:helix-turn-helix domain-containing protein [Streptomyces alkaliterrae]
MAYAGAPEPGTAGPSMASVRTMHHGGRQRPVGDTEEVSTRVPAAVAAVREDLGAVVAEVTGRLRAELPSYARVPPDLLTLRVTRAVDRGMGVVARLYRAGGADAPPATAYGPGVAPAAPAGVGAIGDTVPVGDVLHAHRIGVDVVWSRFAAEMTARQATPEELLEIGEQVWSWAGAMTVRIVRRRALQDVRDGTRPEATEGRLEAYVRMLLTTPADPSAVRVFTGEPGAPRMPFRARAVSGATALTDVVRALRPWLAVDPAGEPMVTAVDGDAAGLLTGRPSAPCRNLVVGLGAAVTAPDLAEEFTAASRAVQTAVAFGMAGVFTRDELGLRAAVAQTPVLGERLVRQRLAPLHERGDEGVQLEEAVAAYLEHGLRLEAAARTLFVHPNTLRNRLRRFEEVSGTSLRDPADLAEVWWALAHQRVHGRPAAVAPSRRDR